MTHPKKLLCKVFVLECPANSALKKEQTHNVLHNLLSFYPIEISGQ